jgi:hypothetical protein
MKRKKMMQKRRKILDGRITTLIMIAMRSMKLFKRPDK